MPTGSEVTVYLENWQKRMLRDFGGLPSIDKITKVTIRPGRGGCLASYKIPPDGMRKGDWLIYLTDPQILEVREQLRLRTAVGSVNVTPDAMKSGAIAFG